MASLPETIIIKPQNDKRLYKDLVLTNKLQVLLISDEITDKAAAALSVNVGYFSDPDDVPGLAHFLEHMLFYSSEKYPEEGSYSKFIAEHGGRSNAYTSTEQTNYQLDVSYEYLEEALDRFAQFFICPLLSADATSREIKAVDSENSKNLTSDPWRMSQLQKTLSSHLHPYHKYGTGNLETLEVGPQSRQQDTREELLKFYHQLYSANLMRLVVYGKDSLEELQTMVETRFSNISNLEREPPRFPGEPCLQEHLQLLVKVVPVTEGHSVELLWPVIPEIQAYRAGPSRYLGHLIGHEGEGSIFALLKARGWATGLSAGEVESSFTYAFFSVSIELTDAGQEHVQELLGLVFQYVELLQGPGGVVEWSFDEVKSVCATKFNYQYKGPPLSYVTSLAANMQMYPVEDWLAAASLPRHFDPSAIEAVLTRLTPQNVRVFWSSKDFDGEVTKQEHWYGTRYASQPLPSSWLQSWKEAPRVAELHLPAPNEFIPRQLALKDIAAAGDRPVLQSNAPLGRMWHKGDTQYQTPKAVLIVDLTCPAAYTSPETALLTRLFTKLLQDDLNEYTYSAEIAGLSYSLEATVQGIQVRVSGYDDKLEMLADKILSRLVSFQLRDDRFPLVKAKLLKDIQNFSYEQPYQQAMYACSHLLQHRRWHILEYLEVIASVGPQDLRLFLPILLSRMFVESFYAGNCTAEEAQAFTEKLHALLSQSANAMTKPIFPSQEAERRIVQLPDGSSMRHVLAGLNPEAENSALLFYLQIGQDNMRQNMECQLLLQAAKQAAFHQLRSVEQLGYIVLLLSRNDWGVQGLQFIIQSTVMGPSNLEERVEAFLDRFHASLQQMEDEEFETHKVALAATKLEKPKSLNEESSYFWSEIDDGTLMFDRKEQEVAMLRTISQKDMCHFYEQHILRGAPLRRKLSIHVVAAVHAKETSQDPGDVPPALIPTMNAEPTSNGGPAKVDSSGREADAVLSESEEKETYDLLKPTVVDDVIVDVQAFKRSQRLFPSLKGRNLQSNIVTSKM